MPAGRPRKPAALLKAAGTWEPSRHAGRELEVPIQYPPRPEKMTVTAAREWDRLRKILEPLGIVALVDAAALERLAILRGQFRRERNARIRLAIAKELRAIESLFGMSPSARAHLKPRKQTTPAPDSKERFFRAQARG